MKHFIVLIVGFLCIFGLIHHMLQQQTLPEADFTYALGATFTSLDPAQMQWNDEIRMAIGLWEGLTTYHPKTTEPIEGVALLPPEISEDGLTYTFTLREDARWSNGDRVDPCDFIYAWRRSMEPGAVGQYSFLILDNIAGAQAYFDWRTRGFRTLDILEKIIDGQNMADLDQEEQDLLASQNLPGWAEENPDWQAMADAFRERHLGHMAEKFTRVGLQRLDDYRLEVRLARPITFFLDLTAFPTFMPIHRRSIEMLRETDTFAAEKLTLWNYDSQWIKPDYHRNGYPGVITNGPFRLTEWKFKRYLLIEKNPYYWDREQVKSNSIMARVFTEASTGFLAYEKGDINWYRDVTRLDFADALVSKARSGQRDDIHIGAAFGTYFYYFNCKPQLPDGSENPFYDSRVRMAFNLATDKKAIVEKVRKTGNPVARNFIPPGSIPGYYCPPGPAGDPKEAAILLGSAGYPDGKGMPNVEILYNTGYGHDRIAEAIAQMWQNNLNVSVTLKGKETKTFDEDKTNQQFMICRGGWYGDYGDPTTFLDMMHSENNQNDSKFSNPAYDRLIEAASHCRDPQQRLEILAEAEEMLMREYVPILPINFYVNLAAYRPNVKGLYQNPRDLNPFKYIYVEK